MNTWLISYDLQRPIQNYPGLIGYLQSIGAVKVLLSVWIYKGQGTNKGIHDAVKQNGGLDANDRLLVTGLNGNAAWTNLLISDTAGVQLLSVP